MVVCLAAETLLYGGTSGVIGGKDLRQQGFKK
jgi:hypothetical protein